MLCKSDTRFSRQHVASFIIIAGILIYISANILNIRTVQFLTLRIEEFFLFLLSISLVPLLFSKKDDEAGEFLKNVLWGLILCFLILNFGHILRKMSGNVLHPRQWDFFDFYITGKIAATGGNIYSPELFKAVALPVPPRQDFINEVLMVGSKYPPQTSLFFALFGFFSFTISIILFSLVQFISLILSGFEIKKIINNDQNGLLISFVLIFLFTGTGITLEYLAPNFLVVYLLLKSINSKSEILSGVLLGAAVLFRPLFLILLIDFLISKRFKHILGIIITLVTTSILSLFVFGYQTYMNYFINGPFTRVPIMDVYSHYTFCSLNTFLLRKNFIVPIWGSPFFHPLTLVCVVIILLFITAVMIRHRGSYLDAFNFLTPWALFLYPETWWSYTVFLIFPLVNLYKNREQLNDRWFLAIAIPIFILLNDFMAVSPNGAVLGLFAFAVANTFWLMYMHYNHKNGSNYA